MGIVVQIRRANIPVHVRRRDLLTYKDYRRALTGQTFSQTADALTTFTLAEVLVFGPVGKASTSALLGTMMMAAIPLIVIGPIAGSLSDRFSRQSILVKGHCVRATVTALAAVSAIGAWRNVGFIAMAALMAITRILYTARATSIPRLVRRHELVAADSTSLIVSVIAGGLGAGIGSLVAEREPLAAFALAAAGQLAAALCYRLIHIPLGGGQMTRSTTRLMFSELLLPRTRFAVLSTASHRLLLGTCLASIAVMIDSKMNLSTTGGVVVLSSGAVGSFVGSLCAEWATETFPRKIIALLSFGLTGTCMAGTALFPQPIVGLATLLCAAFLFQVLRLRSDASIQATISPQILGHVFAAYDIVYNLAFIFGGIIGVIIASRVSISLVLSGVVVAYLVLAVTFTMIDDGKNNRAHHPTSRTEVGTHTRPKFDGSVCSAEMWQPLGSTTSS